MRAPRVSQADLGIAPECPQPIFTLETAFPTPEFGPVGLDEHEQTMTIGEAIGPGRRLSRPGFKSVRAMEALLGIRCLSILSVSPFLVRNEGISRVARIPNFDWFSSYHDGRSSTIIWFLMRYLGLRLDELPRTFSDCSKPLKTRLLVAPQGFEPRYSAPEADVLPLNEGAMLAARVEIDVQSRSTFMSLKRTALAVNVARLHRSFKQGIRTPRRRYAGLLVPKKSVDAILRSRNPV